MLAAACDLPGPFLDETAELARVEEVLEVAAARFAGLVEERIDRSLYRSYVEAEENLTTVRGRIVVGEDMRRNYALRHCTYCRFGDFSWDVPEYWVLRQVVRLLAGWGFSPRLGQRLWVLDAALGEVTPNRYAPADLDRFAYHRLNEDYRPLHRL
jgi:5-methylcytosine-specific restriction enzyme subunit McrC